MWPHSMPAAQVLSYWQQGDDATAVCALRVLKSEVACGIPAERERAAASRDGKWMVSGNWAVIQCSFS